MKRIVLLSLVTMSTTAVFGQTRPLTEPEPQPFPGSSTNDASRSAATNASTASVSVDKLARDLRELHTLVEQTVPALSTFNQNFATSAPSSGDLLAGAISNLVSGVLNRNQNQNATSTPAQTPPLLAELVARLRGYSDANSIGLAATNALQELVSLETNLQFTASLLRDLIGSTNAASSPSQVISSSPQTNSQSLPPTGRPPR